jgi:dTMP kinase
MGGLCYNDGMEGILITFEGPEGSGKTTQAKLLFKYLDAKGYKVVLTNEPGGTLVGKRTRKILLDPKLIELCPLAELFLYLADRAQHVEEFIKPKLREGKIVICDRFVDATRVYQGYGRGLPLKTIDKLNLISTQGIMPDLTIILDIDSFTKLKKTPKDRIEQAGVDFHTRVRDGYHKIAQMEPKRVKIIKVDGPIGVVQLRIRKYVDELLKSKGK